MLNSPPSPPPLPPLMRLWSAKPVKVKSVTRDEIARFWRRKKFEEEDHLLAAIKAAARIRARRLMEEDYFLFEEALNDDCVKKKVKEIIDINEDKNKEVPLGIKDWWTKSKYAYLNQPALKSMEKNKVTSSSTFTPYSLCFYKPPASPAHALIAFSA